MCVSLQSVWVYIHAAAILVTPSQASAAGFRAAWEWLLIPRRAEHGVTQVVRDAVEHSPVMAGPLVVQTRHLKRGEQSAQSGALTQFEGLQQDISCPPRRSGTELGLPHHPCKHWCILGCDIRARIRIRGHHPAAALGGELLREDVLVKITPESRRGGWDLHGVTTCPAARGERHCTRLPASRQRRSNN